jgi:hypothetical protein
MRQKEAPMRRIYVRLTDPTLAALVRAAEAERRHPSDQAALLIERALGTITAQPCGKGGVDAGPAR